MLVGLFGLVIDDDDVYCQRGRRPWKTRTNVEQLREAKAGTLSRVLIER